MAKKSSKSSTPIKSESKKYRSKIPRDNLTVAKIPSLIIGLGVVFGIGFGLSYLAARGLPNPSRLPTLSTIANPASMSCKKNGGTTMLEKDVQGNETGFCNLPDGTRCEEWALFRNHICAQPTRTKDGNDVLKILVTDDLKKNLPEFSLSSSDGLIDKYGARAYDTLQNNPQLMQKLQKLDKTFTDISMQVGSPNKIATFKDKQQILLLIGCVQSSCGGTVRAVAFDPKNGNVYMLSETPQAATDTKNTPVLIFGNPDERIEQLLLYFYLNPDR